MNRRGFLGLLGMTGAAAVAAKFGLMEMEETNRVYSFPSQIRIASDEELESYDYKYMYLNSFKVPNPRMNYRLFNITAPLPFKGGDKMNQPFKYADLA